MLILPSEAWKLQSPVHLFMHYSQYENLWLLKQVHLYYTEAPTAIMNIYTITSQGSHMIIGLITKGYIATYTDLILQCLF